MIRSYLSPILTGFTGVGITTLLMFGSLSPAQAQPQLQDLLETTPTTPLRFSPYTVGSVIAGFESRIYVLNAQAEQWLRVTVNSMGARAVVVIYDSQGQELAVLSGFSEAEEFVYELPESGNYYIFCYSSPTYHYYDVTVRVD